MQTLYVGKYRNRVVSFKSEGRKWREFLPGPSRKLVDHSLGFEWSYAGSGPAQLALALLLDATSDKEVALRYYQDFKWDYVAKWTMDWEITANEINEWIKTKQEDNDE